MAATHTLYLGNLSDTSSDDSLKGVLGKIAPVVSWSRVVDDSGRKPFGFCGFADVGATAQAVRLLNGLEIGGKALRVKPDVKAEEAISAHVALYPDLDTTDEQKLVELREAAKEADRAAAAVAKYKLELERAKGEERAKTFLEKGATANSSPATEFKSVSLVVPPALLGTLPPPPPGGPPLAGSSSSDASESVKPVETVADAAEVTQVDSQVPDKAVVRELRRKEEDYKNRRRAWERRERDKADDRAWVMRDAEKRAAEATELVKKQRDFDASYNDVTQDLRYYGERTMSQLRKDRAAEIKWEVIDREQQAREESMENQGSSQAPDTIASGDVGVSLSAPQDKDAGAAAIPSTTSDVNISTPTVATNSAAVVGQTRMFGVKQPVLIKPETQTSVFGDDDDDVVVVKKRKLEKIKYTDEQLRAVGIDPEAERRKRMKDLVASLPVSRGAIFEYKVNWALLDTSIMEGRIRPWVRKKIVQFMGEEESYVDFICSQVKSKITPEKLLNEVQAVMDDDAEEFTMKLWRLVIYETEAKAAEI